MGIRSRLTRAEHERRLKQVTAAGAKIGSNVHIAPGSALTGGVRIDDNVWINGPAAFRGAGQVHIGSWTAIGYDLIATTNGHRIDRPNLVKRLHQQHGFLDLDATDDITIGPGCWIGDRVTVVAGAQVGAGTVIAAGAVVSRGDHPPYSVLGGVPAKVVRRRAADDVIDVLCSSQWWTWPADRIGRNREFFEADITAIAAPDLNALIVD